MLDLVWTLARDRSRVAGIARHARPAEDHAAILRQHGLRLTAQRLAVLRAMAAHPHGTADDVYAAVVADLGAISRQAVYDTLTTLTANGVLRRIEPAGSSARYETRVGDNHHHLVCRACGRLVDVDCAVGDTPCLIPSDDGGYEVDEAEVIYWGVCPACRTTKPKEKPRRA